MTEYQAIEAYLPSSNSKFKTLITTRKRLGSPVKLIELDILKSEAAIKLLISLVGAERVNRERKIAEEICEWLGYLPLGIELVGKFLERKTTWNLERIKEKFAEEGLEAKAVQKDEKIITTAKRGVAAAFELSWSELTPAGQELAYYLSIFALAPISLDLIKAYDVEEKSEEIEDLIDDYLINLSLLKYDEQNQTYSLHQLIREYLQTKLKQVPQVEKMKQKFCQEMIEIARSIPQTPTQEEIRRVALAIPHLSTVAKELTDYIDDENLIWSGEGLGRFYQGQGAYDRAEEWYERSLTVCQSRLGEEVRLVPCE